MSSMVWGAMRRRVVFSSMHSLADSWSRTA